MKPRKMMTPARAPTTDQMTAQPSELCSTTYRAGAVRTATIVANRPSLRHSLANESAESFTPPMSERPGSRSTAEVYAGGFRADRRVYPALRQWDGCPSCRHRGPGDAGAAAVTHGARRRRLRGEVPVRERA